VPRPDRPHIVVILADDLGCGDLSCLNPDSKAQTPHHDRLAAEGMTFTDAHSNSAVCTPTRYGLLTGRYCFRTPLKRGVLHGYSPPLIEDDRPTLASTLKQHGYRTACVGKWHLGLGWMGEDGRGFPEADDEDPGVDFTKPLAAGPHTLGFDTSYIIPASLDMAPYVFIEDGRVTEPPTRKVERSERPKMWRGGWTAEGFEHETCLLELTRRAEATIADHASRDGDDPLFLYVPLPSPHTPHVPRAPFRGKSDAGVYGDYVVEHDWSVGVITAALARHGMADDTLLIVTSDNGAHMRGGGFDFEQEFGHRSNHIYRGQKSDAWDGGHRVPFFARWPGTVHPGSTCDQLVCLTDLMATFTDIVGAARPAEAEDSVSTLPLLQGQGRAVRASVVHHSITGRFALRQGPWKLIGCRGSGGWSLPDRDAPEQPEGQLYHMGDDPEEQHNRYADEAEVVQALSTELATIRGDD